MVFDLYDIIIDFLEKKNFMEKCYDFEKKRGIERIVKAVTNSMKVNDDDSLIVQYIKEHTPENAVVFLTGIGKCYPILRSHKVLNNLHQAFVRCPVVMFFPGTYNEQELILFGKTAYGLQAPSHPVFGLNPFHLTPVSVFTMMPRSWS